MLGIVAVKSRFGIAAFGFVYIFRMISHSLYHNDILFISLIMKLNVDI